MSSSSGRNASRKGRGRQKVEMAKIENETNLQVTFSKRRAGLFKKASELSTLCGAETAVVVFSPGNKAHCFGHPNVESVTSRFLNQNVPPMSDADKLVEAHQKAIINQQNLELTQLQIQLEIEQKRARELERERRECLRLRQRPADLDKLNYRQLDRLKGALLRLRRQLEARVENAAAKNELFDPNSTVTYDPKAAGAIDHDSCPIIPYSSTASTSSVGHNEK